MVTKETAIKEIKDFVTLCNNDGIAFTKVLFFGSALHNKATQYSDIDVLLFADGFSDNQFENISIFSKYVLNHHDLDIKAFSTKKYYEGGLLIDEVKKNCMEIIS